MIVTSLARTFQAAFELLSWVLSQFIWRVPEERARLVVVRAGGGAGRVVARLVGAVLALVHDQQVDGAPELQPPVDAVALARPAASRASSRRRPCRRPPGASWSSGGSGGRPPSGRAAGVVVLDLVVVPQHHGREARLDLAQRLVRAVQRVLLAVLVERLGRADVVDAGLARGLLGAADLVVAHACAVLDRVVGLVVDVVAEADDEVEVLARHRLVRVVVAVRVVLAGPEGEAHGLQRVGRQRGAEAPDGAVLGRRREAVVVLLVGLEARDPRLDVVVDAPRRSAAACGPPRGGSSCRSPPRGRG